MFKKLNAFKLLIGTFAVALALVVTSSASAFTLADFGSTTLKVGSTGQAVMNVQTVVGATADGKFGPNTKAKVMAWQSNHSLTADGVVGPMTKAAMAANDGTSMTYPAGCTSATGFSSTTGQPCSSTSTVPGCAAGALFSSTTGQPCSGGTTTVNSGTNGYLSDIASDSTNRVSTVYESEQDKVVAGFRATARLASQNVTRVRVLMKNTDTAGSSVSLAKYISGASLWFGSTKLATMSVAQADRSSSDDTYTFNFSGLNANIAQDQIGHFYVSVNVNGSLDTGDVSTPGSANWAIVFPDGGLSASSPDGSYDTYNAGAGNVPSASTVLSWGSDVGFTLGKFSANGVKADINLSASNPAATVVAVSNTAATNGVTLLNFTIKATNSDLTVRRVPISVTSTTSGSSAMINTIKLMQGSNVLDTLDGSAGTGTCGAAGVCDYSFINLSSPSNKIAAGTTAEFSVVVDLKSKTAGSYSDGVTLTASLTNANAINVSKLSIQDVNGDQLSTSYRYGSAIGNLMTLRENGVNVVMGTAVLSNTTSTGGLIESVTYSIPVSVTSFGNTLYVGQTTESAATVSAQNGLAFTVQDNGGNDATVAGSAGVAVMIGSAVMSTSDALVEGIGYRLDSGSTKHFTVTVTVTGLSASSYGSTAGYYRVALKQFKTWTDSALTAGPAVSTLNPSASYQTAFQYLNQ